jgi:hypothetical protein
MIKLSKIFLDSHVPLLQLHELFQLDFHQSLRNVMSTKSFMEDHPWNLISDWLGCMEVGPPSASRALELLCGILGFLGICAVN